jgi:hypothetical protein
MPFKAYLFIISLLWAHTASAQANVLICLSPTAHAYHSGYCKGLNACTHKVESITINDAKGRGKDPCGYCYRKTTSSVLLKKLPAFSGWQLLITVLGIKVIR